jgi:hypothetical protein
MSRLLIPPLLAVTFAATALPATAQTNYCAERTQIAERLASGYSEQLVGGGMQNQNGLIEVWTTPSGNTWTILMTRPDGISCVMATGTDWYSRKPAIEPAGVAG